jgi:hypothetical protein
MSTGEANYFRDYKRLGVIAKLATSYMDGAKNGTGKDKLSHGSCTR